MRVLSHLFGFPVEYGNNNAGAVGLLGNEQEGLAIDATNDQVYVKNLSTPANNALTTVADWLTNTNASTKLVRGADGIYTTVAANTPALHVHPTHGRGLLVEPAATNLCLQSQDFATTWVNTNTDEPTTNNTAPDGTATADEIAATSTADQAFAVYQAFTGLTANNQAVCSVFLKAGTNATLAQLAWDSDGSGADGCFCNFNLSTGAKGTVTALAAGTATSASIEDNGDGFYRCSIVGKIATGTVGRFTISIIDDIGATVFQAADLTDNDSIIAWQGQVEAAASNASSVPTSPIPTVGATVTRTADDLSESGSFPQSTTAMSMYAKFILLTGTIPSSDQVIALGEDSTNYMSFMGRTADNIGQRSRVDNVIQCNSGVGTTSVAVVKVTGRFKEDDFAALLTGDETPNTDTSGTMPNGAVELDIGQRLAGGTDALGVPMLMFEAIVLPRAWSDDEIIAQNA